jgi:hypothetical protein
MHQQLATPIRLMGRYGIPQPGSTEISLAEWRADGASFWSAAEE